jgi:hypothetical protein
LVAQGSEPRVVVPTPLIPTPPVIPTPVVPAQVSTRRLQGFSVVLLLGEIQGGGTPADGLSTPARKALADLKDFLPYKSYRLLDTQWIAGKVSESRGDSYDVGQLRGPDNQQYDFKLWSLGGRPHSRAFYLTTARVGREGTSLEESKAQVARVAALEDAVLALRQKNGDKTAELREAEADLKRARQIAEGPQTLLQTTFDIDAGETVVVGTSRVQGDKALIVLLTAVPR